jgi:hypothetical protein
MEAIPLGPPLAVLAVLAVVAFAAWVLSRIFPRPR